jgi:hypothetical protein
LLFAGNIVRSWCIGLVLAAGLARPAAAETVPSPAESERWDSPADAISITNDPAAPYIAFFTPPYRVQGASDLSWSMMATRWRESGVIQLSVGVRILHAGAQAWDITGWQVGHAPFMVNAALPSHGSSLKPFSTCTGGLCRTYEAASFALPLALIEQAAISQDGDLEIAILTRAGEKPSIRFPASILADLCRSLATYRTTSAEP